VGKNVTLLLPDQYCLPSRLQIPAAQLAHILKEAKPN